MFRSTHTATPVPPSPHAQGGGLADGCVAKNDKIKNSFKNRQAYTGYELSFLRRHGARPPCVPLYVRAPHSSNSAPPPRGARGGGGLRGDTTRHGKCAASSTCSSPSSPPAAAMSAMACRPRLSPVSWGRHWRGVDAAPPEAGGSAAGALLRSGDRSRANVFGFGMTVWLLGGRIGAGEGPGAWRDARRPECACSDSAATQRRSSACRKWVGR